MGKGMAAGIGWSMGLWWVFSLRSVDRSGQRGRASERLRLGHTTIDWPTDPRDKQLTHTYPFDFPSLTHTYPHPQVRSQMKMGLQDVVGYDVETGGKQALHAWVLLTYVYMHACNAWRFRIVQGLMLNGGAWVYVYAILFCTYISRSSFCPRRRRSFLTGPPLPFAPTSTPKQPKQASPGTRGGSPPSPTATRSASTPT